MRDRHVPPLSFEGQGFVEFLDAPRRLEVRAMKLLAPVAHAEQLPIALHAGVCRSVSLGASRSSVVAQIL